MGSNYKHLYQQTKYMLGKYQDEIVPGLRKRIEAAKSALRVMAQNGCCRVCALPCSNKGIATGCSMFRWNGRGE